MRQKIEGKRIAMLYPTKILDEIETFQKKFGYTDRTQAIISLLEVALNKQVSTIPIYHNQLFWKVLSKISNDSINTKTPLAVVFLEIVHLKEASITNQAPMERVIIEELYNIIQGNIKADVFRTNNNSCFNLLVQATDKTDIISAMKLVEKEFEALHFSGLNRDNQEVFVSLKWGVGWQDGKTPFDEDDLVGDAMRDLIHTNKDLA